MPPSAYAYAFIALVVLVLVILWIRHRRRADSLLERETKERLANEALEAARKKEKEIADAAAKVRREPGPTVPDLGGVRSPDGPGPRPPA